MTPRQYETARRFALGQPWKQVMAEMGCARATVQKHRTGAMAAFGVQTMPELWTALGWLVVPDMRASADDAGHGMADSSAPAPIRRVA